MKKCARCGFDIPPKSCNQKQYSKRKFCSSTCSNRNTGILISKRLNTFERNKLIVKKYKTKTLEEIAKEMNITHQRVQQIISVQEWRGEIDIRSIVKQRKHDAAKNMLLSQGKDFKHA